MEIRFAKISASLASDLKDYILPAVRDDEEFDQFTFYAAIADDRLSGVAVADIQELEPEILSIGISEEYQDQGIAKDLIRYVVSDIYNTFDGDALEQIPNRIFTRVVEKAGAIQKLDHLLTDAGFVPVEQGAFYEVKIGDLRGNDFVQDPKTMSRINTPESSTGYQTLRDTPSEMVMAFSEELIQHDEFPGIEISELDEDLTVFGIRDGRITMCILFLKEDQGVVQNAFLYRVSENDLKGRSLMYLLSVSASEAIRKFPDDVRLSFWIGNDTTQKLIDRILPEAIRTDESISYELSLTKMQKSHKKRFLDGLKSHPLYNEDLVCATCRYCMKKTVLECDIYEQKPDRVLENEPCEFYEAAD